MQGQEDPLVEKMATHSSIVAWKIPWIEEPGRPQSMGPQRVRHDLGTEHVYKWQIAQMSTNSRMVSSILHVSNAII